MKTSNKLILGFFGVIISLMILVTIQLKAEYQKIDLNDKFRGYEKVPLRNIRFLEIRSSIYNNQNKDIENDANGFAVTCLNDKQSVLLLPKNDNFRKYISYQQNGDTLLINSDLAYTSYLTNIFLLGMKLEGIKANCSTIILDSITSEDLKVDLERKAEIDFNTVNTKYIELNLSNYAKGKFSGNSLVNELDLNLQQKSTVDLGDIKIGNIHLEMSPSAKISTGKANLAHLAKVKF